MRQMGAMGPEATLLAGRLAEYRATQVYGNLESPHEDPIYVAASVYAHLADAVEVARYPRGPGVWARLRVALRLRPRRRGEATASLLGLAAGPMGTLEETDRAAGLDGIAVPLAGLPLR